MKKETDLPLIYEFLSQEKFFPFIRTPEIEKPGAASQVENCQKTQDNSENSGKLTSGMFNYSIYTELYSIDIVFAMNSFAETLQCQSCIFGVYTQKTGLSPGKTPSFRQKHMSAHENTPAWLTRPRRGILREKER